jgi:hypothetical protein
VRGCCCCCWLAAADELSRSGWPESTGESMLLVCEAVGLAAAVAAAASSAARANCGFSCMTWSPQAHTCYKPTIATCFVSSDNRLVAATCLSRAALLQTCRLSHALSALYALA